MVSCWTFEHKRAYASASGIRLGSLADNVYEIEVFLERITTGSFIKFNMNGLGR